jgi:chemotaxis protein MotB
VAADRDRQGDGIVVVVGPMAAKGNRKDRDGGNVIIRKTEIVEGGHHGGAWKVAYADFVTAMMAFFLLMWLINATTEAQRRGIADYFSPTTALARAASGAGKIFGGKTPYERGNMVSDNGVESVVPGHAQQMPEPQDAEANEAPQTAVNGPQDPTDQPPGKPVGADQPVPNNPLDGPQQPGSIAAQASPQPAQALGQAQFLANAGTGESAPQATKADAAASAAGLAARRAAAAARERAAFDTAAEEIRDAVRADPTLRDLAPQLAIDQTPEGLRIQLLDEERRPMFATGSSVMQDRGRALLLKIAPVLMKLPEAISIAGHTDAAPYKGGDKTNWDLSAERANATRRLLADAGMPDARFRSVTGNADRDPLLPADPLAAANRRIAIVVLRAAPGPS